jgi:hypothetical protein
VRTLAQEQARARRCAQSKNEKGQQMVTRTTSMVLAGVVAAAGAVVLGWQVPASSAQALKAMLTPAPGQTAAVSERAAPSPAPVAEVRPAPAPEDKSEARPEGRMEPSGADADRWVFRFVTPSTKMNIDPARGKASLETPLGSVSLDTEKREARMDAAPLYLGLGW